MKTKLILISVLSAASALFSGKVNAQISLGGNLSYLKFMGEEMKTSHPGLGIRGWYETSDRTTVSLSANYFFGSSVKSSFTVLDSAGNPANADMETSTSVLQFDLRGNYYF